ncbi:MAG: type IV pili methyl-accepting chemotaxis transducer N-terminal domain-containing protein [Pseudomonadota bacterium]
MRLTVSAVFVVLAGFGVARAADVDASVAKRHVNLSALQPMLAEQISKAACFARLGINEQANLSYLAGSFELFDKTRRGLRDGNKALGLEAETNQGVLTALNRLDRASSTWNARVAAVGGSSNLSEEMFFAITGGTVPVVKAAAEVAEKAERAYAVGDRSFPLDISLRINLASRQRTLSQRMAKDLCLIESGFNAAEHRAELAEGIKLFEASLDALRNGFPAFSLAPEADPQQRAQLDFVATLWDEVKPIYARVAAGEAPTPAELRLIAWQNNQILSQMNAAVFNYETRNIDG